MEARKHLRFAYQKIAKGKLKEISDAFSPHIHVTLESVLDVCKANGLIKPNTIIKTSVSTSNDFRCAMKECAKLVCSNVFGSLAAHHRKKLKMVLVPEYTFSECADICDKMMDRFETRDDIAGNKSHDYTAYCSHQSEPGLALMLCKYGQ